MFKTLEILFDLDSGDLTELSKLAIRPHILRTHWYCIKYVVLNYHPDAELTKNLLSKLYEKGYITNFTPVFNCSCFSNI